MVFTRAARLSDILLLRLLRLRLLLLFQLRTFVSREVPAISGTFRHFPYNNSKMAKYFQHSFSTVTFLDFLFLRTMTKTESSFKKRDKNFKCFLLQ